MNQLERQFWINICFTYLRTILWAFLLQNFDDNCKFYSCILSWFNPNLTTGFTGLVGKVRKNYLPKEEGREGGEKKRAQRARRAQDSNPGPAAC